MLGEPPLIMPSSGKNVQFLDMNRLPSKYRDRVVGQLKNRREQAEAERLEKLEQVKGRGGGG